jgi:transcriptional regulator with XRE-family HTH domain
MIRRPSARRVGVAQSAASVGERIRQRRLELGLTQRQLGGPGVTWSFISRVENGNRTPSVKALRLRAANTHIPPSSLAATTAAAYETRLLGCLRPLELAAG